MCKSVFCLSAIIALFFSFSPSFAQDKINQNKSISETGDSLSVISGTVVCITEELAKIRKIKPECEKYGCIFGLKASDNMIWSFYRNPVGLKLREDNRNRGKKIEIKGKLLHRAKIIVVSEYKILEEN